jgi:hypothetical protein
VTFANANAVDTTATFSTTGTYVLQLSANDTAATTTDTVTVTVYPANTAPSVGAGTDQALSLPDAASLDGTVSDDGYPAGGSLTQTWSKDSGPGTVTFGNANAVDTTATFSTPGTYVLKLSANDTALTTTDTVTVEVNVAPVARWKLNETSGTVADDSVGSNDGTVTGATWDSGGELGGALLFDETDDCVHVPDFSLNSSFTVSFWFKPTDNSGTYYQYFFSWGSVLTQNSVNVWLVEASTADKANTLRTCVMDGNDSDNTANLDIYDADGFADGYWHHYCVTVSSGNGTKVYIDGSLEKTDASQGGGIINPATAVHFGGRSDHNSSRYYGGKLDDIRVYDKELTGTEVGNLYNE